MEDNTAGAEYPLIDPCTDDNTSEADSLPSSPCVTDYRRAFRAIRWYREISASADNDEKRVLDHLETERQNVKAFYDNKRKQAAQRLALWYSQLDAMMKLNGVERMATPYGTSFYRTAKRKEWKGSPEELLAFAKEMGEPDLIRTKEEPNKPMIEAFVESTGKGAHLLDITEKTEVAVRLKEVA